MKRTPSLAGNRERVRRFRAAWNIPEVVWEERTNTPADPGRADRSLRVEQPYNWALIGEGIVTGLTSVVAKWQFSADHEFEALYLQVESAGDPDYLAEKLSLAAEAAAFPSWQRGDLRSLDDWIGDLSGTLPASRIVSGYKRLGFVLFDLRRFPLPSGGFATTMNVTLTDTALNGTPLGRGGGRR
jgi:hypothetical protein